MRATIAENTSFHIPLEMNLSKNKMNATGLGALLIPSYGVNGLVPICRFVLTELNLTRVALGSRGVTLLANELLAHGRLSVQDLNLTAVNMEGEGLVALIKAYAELTQSYTAKTPWARGVGALKRLNLSSNPLSHAGMQPLLNTHAFPKLEVLKLYNLEKMNPYFWAQLAVAIANHSRFPMIESVCYDVATAHHAIGVDRAVRYVSTKRRSKDAAELWRAWECNELEEAERRERARAGFKKSVKRAATDRVTSRKRYCVYDDESDEEAN